LTDLARWSPPAVCRLRAQGRTLATISASTSFHGVGSSPKCPRARLATDGAPGLSLRALPGDGADALSEIELDRVAEFVGVLDAPPSA